MSETCMHCGENYDLTRDLHIVWLYLVTETKYNHIQAKCPHCASIYRIFVDPATIVQVVKEVKLTVALFTEVHPEIEDLLQRVERSNIEPPREWIAQLYDDMREFGGT